MFDAEYLNTGTFRKKINKCKVNVGGDLSARVDVGRGTGQCSVRNFLPRKAVITPHRFTAPVIWQIRRHTATCVELLLILL